MKLTPYTRGEGRGREAGGAKRRLLTSNSIVPQLTTSHSSFHSSPFASLLPSLRSSPVQPPLRRGQLFRSRLPPPLHLLLPHLPIWPRQDLNHSRLFPLRRVHERHPVPRSQPKWLDIARPQLRRGRGAQNAGRPEHG